MPIETLGGALQTNAQGLSDLLGRVHDGAFLTTDLDHSRAREYEAVATEYGQAVLQILGDPQIQRVLGPHIPVVGYNGLVIELRSGEVNLVVRRFGGRSSDEEVERLTQGYFPGSSWTRIHEGSENTAIKKLEMSDLVGATSKNRFFEGFILGLNARIQTARDEEALARIGETTDEDLERRIQAVQEANGILAAALEKTRTKKR